MIRNITQKEFESWPHDRQVEFIVVNCQGIYPIHEAIPGFLNCEYFAIRFVRSSLGEFDIETISKEQAQEEIFKITQIIARAKAKELGFPLTPDEFNKLDMLTKSRIVFEHLSEEKPEDKRFIPGSPRFCVFELLGYGIKCLLNEGGKAGNKKLTTIMVDK